MQEPLYIQVTGQRSDASEVFRVFLHASCLHPLNGAGARITLYSILAGARWLTALWLWSCVYVELEVLKARLAREIAVPFGMLLYASGSSIHDAVIALTRAGSFTDEVHFCATFGRSVARLWALLLARFIIDVALVVQVSLEIIVAGILRQS